jgi:hypothetical protein
MLESAERVNGNQPSVGRRVAAGLESADRDRLLATSRGTGRSRSRVSRTRRTRAPLNRWSLSLRGWWGVGGGSGGRQPGRTVHRPPVCARDPGPGSNR